MNYAAINHEATQTWCHAIAPGRFVFRIQTGKDDMRRVLLHSRDKYLPEKLKNTHRITEMHRVATDGLHDYYEAELEFKMVCLRYCFELEDQSGARVYLANDGFTKNLPGDKECLFDCPQTLREEELFAVPGWARHQVVYQIFPSRFATDRKVSDKVWYQSPISPIADLGGNLRGITQRLDYIRDLGVDVIYLTPVFSSRSTHKYDTIDYYTIDPGFGTKDDLRQLIDTAHKKGLRVILDAVFNHTSPEFFAFADLKKNKEKSAYRNWYYAERFPLRGFPVPNYKCFGYYGNMPKVNLQNPDAARYFIDVALYWLREVHADGWRLDVADEIAHNFWRQFRREVKAEFPDALIIGEIWHHAPDFLQGDQWDTVMNYPFYRAVDDFAARGAITASEFLGRLGRLRGTTHTNAYPLLWNLIGSHDTPRILHRCAESKSRHRLAAALQLLSPGMPMIYYGDEVAMTGAADPDCRRGMLWDESRQDRQMLDWYKRLLRIRKECPAITEGRTVTEEADDAQSLIRITREHDGTEVTLLFHCAEAPVRIPEYTGRIDLLTDTPFSGTLNGIGAAVFLK